LFQKFRWSEDAVKSLTKTFQEKGVFFVSFVERQFSEGKRSQDRIFGDRNSLFQEIETIFQLVQEIEKVLGALGG
jgi:hypothetical protein